ncbi:hypothetical protein [Candidatus Rhabdochlamydia porcellionis]|jgi:hypothetical protein|uniref:Uncharacterized protein n=1 Tax=Candidatus Rhabdochlamydia porcellionis TaxID=225148 RepID=A0ABX8Z479_9BACT|nr:hypothetical protein [Candidatus Rhabdochlamydia porcellionis]QZA59312.1 hypothetical protein RHAB15C_0001198 [Candidatus Rhabdochlamydia porcellionis]
MSVITDYPLGVQAIFNSKIANPFLSNYNYVFTALAQSYQVYAATKVVAKTLQAYNRPMATFPWYVRVLAVTAVPFSICFEINRWSLGYQPHFWIKKTIHWVCDHTGLFMYAICIVSSIALAMIGKPGMLIGVAVTFSIDQIQNYDILPAYYCHVLKTINTLVSVFFSKRTFSCWISITELASNLYFSRLIQNTPLHAMTNTIVTDKTVADVKNNPFHIHFKPELKERKAADLLVFFKGITWHATQTKELLSKDNDWIKRADTSKDPISYVKNLHKYVENVCSDSKQLAPIELYLKVIIQYLCNHPKKNLENKELVLNVIAQLRKNSQEGVSRLGEIAEKLYERIDSFSFEEQVLQLLYKKRKEIFKQFFHKELCEKTMMGSFKEVFHSWAKDAFDSHMGINFFLIDRTPSLIKANICAMCAAEEVNTEEYFCDQEGNSLYASENIIDLLMNQLGNTLSWDSVNQWWQEQNMPQDINAIKNKILSIQTAEAHLKALYEIKKDDFHYCNFSFLKNISTEKRIYFFSFIKQDCKEYFIDLKEKIQIDKDEEEFANKICLDIQQAVDVYPKIEKLLVSMLLKIGIFQLKM